MNDLMEEEFLINHNFKHIKVKVEETVIKTSSHVYHDNLNQLSRFETTIKNLKAAQEACETQDSQIEERLA